jgi:hypothetical protein
MIGCHLDTDGDGNCHVHPGGCPPMLGWRILTLTEPWATLVMLGEKEYETRSWTHSYRGRLGIHAAKGMPRWARQTVASEPFRSVLCERLNCTNAAHILEVLDQTRGKILGAANLRFIDRVEKVHEGLNIQERAFGDYSPNRYAWRLERPQPLPEPILARGALGLWTYQP